MPGKRGRPVSMKNRKFTSIPIGNSVVIFDASDTVMAEIMRKLKLVGKGEPQGLTGSEYEHMEKGDFRIL